MCAENYMDVLTSKIYNILRLDDYVTISAIQLALRSKKVDRAAITARLLNLCAWGKATRVRTTIEQDGFSRTVQCFKRKEV